MAPEPLSSDCPRRTPWGLGLNLPPAQPLRNQCNGASAAFLPASGHRSPAATRLAEGALFPPGLPSELLGHWKKECVHAL
jgi:hypothetical protein